MHPEARRTHWGHYSVRSAMFVGHLPRCFGRTPSPPRAHAHPNHALNIKPQPKLSPTTSDLQTQAHSFTGNSTTSGSFELGFNHYFKRCFKRRFKGEPQGNVHALGPYTTCEAHCLLGIHPGALGVRPHLHAAHARPIHTLNVKPQPTASPTTRDLQTQTHSLTGNSALPATIVRRATTSMPPSEVSCFFF